MFSKALIISALLGLGVISAGTAAGGKLLARDSSMSSYASVVYQTPLKFGESFELIPNPYGSFTFQVLAPQGQKVKAEWSIGCRKGDFSRDVQGSLTRKTSLARTLRPTIGRADYCTLSVSASRAYGTKGRLLVSLFGHGTPQIATMREP